MTSSLRAASIGAAQPRAQGRVSPLPTRETDVKAW